MRCLVNVLPYLAAVVLFSTPAVAQDTIKIGMICAYSGQFAETSTSIDNGVNLYVKKHGDRIAGKKVEIIRKDTGGIAPDVAKRLAQELVVRDKVDVLACFESTPNALAAADVSAQAKKFMVVMTASAAVVTKVSTYLVRTSWTVAQINATLGTWAAKNGVRKAYTLVTDYKPGHDAEVAYQGAFKAAGGEIVGSVRYPVTNLDFNAFIQRAVDSNADGIYAWVPSGAQSIALGKAVADRGIDKSKTKVMGQSTLTDEDSIASMGDAALGLITAGPYDYTYHSPTNDDFVSAYNAEFKRNPDAYAVAGYDGMHAIYEALRKANGKTDGDTVIAAAKGMQWESPRGPVMVDPQTRELVQDIYLRRVEKVGGKLVNVEFDKIKQVTVAGN